MSAIVDVYALASALAELARRDPLVRRDLASALGLPPDDKPASKLVTVAAYAAAHSLGKSTIRRAIREGRLIATRIGRSVRVSADATIAECKPDAVMARAARRLGLVPPNK